MNKKRIQLALLIIFPPVIFCLIGILFITLTFWLAGTGLLGQNISKSIDGYSDFSGIYFLIMIIVGIYAFLSSLVSWIILIPSLSQLNFKAKLNKVLLISLLIIPTIMILGFSPLLHIIFSAIGMVSRLRW